MSKGTIFNVERFALHDGPGIRTLVFLKGCPLRCLWCANPEGQASTPELSFDSDKCLQCLRCVLQCPHNAITIENGYPKTEPRKCKECFTCVDICPERAREVIGKLVTPEEVIKEVLKDSIYYRRTQGGITLGGGEPLMQPEFALTIIKRCQELGISTCIETSGFAELSTGLQVLLQTDTVFIDIKHMDHFQCLQVTGRSNKRVLQLLIELSRKRKPVIIRVPVIPGINSSKEHIAEVFRFVKSELDNVIRVELLPYHELGIHKYSKLGRTYPLADTTPPTEEFLMELQRIGVRESIPCHIVR